MLDVIEWVGPALEDQDMLTIEEVARQLDISVAKVRELVRTRQITTVDQDGQLQFTQQAVNSYILSVFAAIDDEDNDDWDDD